MTWNYRVKKKQHHTTNLSISVIEGLVWVKHARQSKSKSSFGFFVRFITAGYFLANFPESATTKVKYIAATKTQNFCFYYTCSLVNCRGFLLCIPALTPSALSDEIGKRCFLLLILCILEANWIVVKASEWVCWGNTVDSLECFVNNVLALFKPLILIKA